MKKLNALAMITTLALGGTALAQPPGHGHGHGHGGHGRRGKLERLDADKDGKVTLAEMKRSAAGKFQQLDANADGRVTQAELQTHHEQMRAKFAEKRAARRAEGDTEPSARGKRWREKHAQMIGRFFEKMDSNRDGAIDAAEFESKLARKFARMDTNRDGAIEASELRHGRGKHGRKHGKQGASGFGDQGAAGGGAAEQ